MHEKERKGFVVLVVLLFLLLFSPYFYKMIYPPPPAEQPLLTVLTPEGAERAALNLEVLRAAKPPRASIDANADKKEVALFAFDPNDLPAADWQKLGFSAKQVKVIKNYEAKGGRFRSAKDVAKIYSISEADFKRIAPYLRFGTSNSQSTAHASAPPERFERKPTVIAPIDINKADSLTFQTLKGIGPSYARRIVRFRESLGGFHDIAQVKEVFGFPEELYEEIKPFLFITEGGIKQIDINKVELEVLAKHPYLSYKQARLVIAYRAQHGSFRSVEDFRKIIPSEPDFLRKIEPYLNFK